MPVLLDTGLVTINTFSGFELTPNILGNNVGSCFMVLCHCLWIPLQRSNPVIVMDIEVAKYDAY